MFNIQVILDVVGNELATRISDDRCENQVLLHEESRRIHAPAIVSEVGLFKIDPGATQPRSSWLAFPCYSSLVHWIYGGFRDNRQSTNPP
jgi:hypothetical protein